MKNPREMTWKELMDELRPDRDTDEISALRDERDRRIRVAAGYSERPGSDVVQIRFNGGEDGQL